MIPTTAASTGGAAAELRTGLGACRQAAKQLSIPLCQVSGPQGSTGTRADAPSDARQNRVPSQGSALSQKVLCCASWQASLASRKRARVVAPRERQRCRRCLLPGEKCSRVEIARGEAVANGGPTKSPTRNARARWVQPLVRHAEQGGRVFALDAAQQPTHHDAVAVRVADGIRHRMRMRMRVPMRGVCVPAPAPVPVSVSV